MLLRLFSSAAAQQPSFSHEMQKSITPAVCTALKSQGFAVVDGLCQGLVDIFRQEIVDLYKDRLMHKNATHLVKGEQSHRLEKSHVQEAELSIGLGAAETQRHAPMCASLGEDKSLATMLALFMPEVKLDSQAVKLQYNEGLGGCFPLHVDSDPTVDQRLVTAIFYLNPRWQPQHSGLLQLFPWPLPPVTIEPLHGRLVLFPSQRMIHRVTPYSSQHMLGNGQGRCCFTIWMSSSPRARVRGRGPSPPSQQLPLSSLQPKASPEEDPLASIQFLLHPRVRLHAAKLKQESLCSKVTRGPALDAVLHAHDAEVGIIRNALGRYEGLIQELTLKPDLAKEAARRFMVWL